MKKLFVFFAVSLILAGGSGVSSENSLAKQSHDCWCLEHIF
ncbi:hypothetical protein [Salinicoccus cyprini]|nr:hypothetical protein [Salinicoccus cyprini]